MKRYYYRLLRGTFRDYFYFARLRDFIIIIRPRAAEVLCHLTIYILSRDLWQPSEVRHLTVSRAVTVALAKL